MPRDKNELLAERVAWSWEFPSPTANTDAAHKLWTVPAGRKFRLRRVWINDPTGLAANGSNFYLIALQKGTTTMASVSTATTALVADTPQDMTLAAADADRLAAAGDVIRLLLDATGVVTLPAGRIMVEGDLF
jgi:hypothetical protein